MGHTVLIVTTSPDVYVVVISTKHLNVQKVVTSLQNVSSVEGHIQQTKDLNQTRRFLSSNPWRKNSNNQELHTTSEAQNSNLLEFPPLPKKYGPYE